MKAVSLLGLAASLLLSGCQNQSENSLSGEIQGTSYHIKFIAGDSPVNPVEIQQGVDGIFRLIDEELSNWRDDSGISLFNQNKTTEWQPVAPAITELVSIARNVHDLSGGCYDLTVKPLFDLWGFARHQQTVPTDAAIKEVLSHVGMSKIEIDLNGHRLRKKDPDVQISLDSIAQGYTVGAISQLLEKQGIQNYLAEVGGEMKVKGVKADGSHWRVAIEKPTPMVREVQRVLDLDETAGTAVMTSGTYRNFFESGGKHYSHIIDPRTGAPVTHKLLSTTVLHENPTMADAWSTALLCVGEIEGPRIAELQQLKALFIYGEGDQLKEQMSSRFAGRGVAASNPGKP